MKIAIIGTGIAGLTAAAGLAGRHELTVFEAADWIGGHTHTVDVEEDGRIIPVDTGFIVFNDWTYPNFIDLLRKLGVPWQPSDMSFSLQCEKTGLEYNGTSLNSLFAQRRNLLRPSFLHMIWEILRFNREAPRFLDAQDETTTLGDWLQARHFGGAFVGRGRGDARLSGPVLHRLLRPPRLPVRGRPPAVADRLWRVA
jgi:predicted NAD/FAD-binding protein